ncbi:MAG: hypothetical protein IJQ25_06510, partial [Oscillibacter sp.]|nr:hypothetical protein [Oscillibacter sp.]
MAENAVRGGGRSRRGASQALVVVGGLILVALVGVIVALLMMLNRPEPEPEPEAPPQRTTVVHEESAERQIEEIINQTPVEPGYYQVSMTTDWYFPEPIEAGTTYRMLLNVGGGRFANITC